MSRFIDSSIDGVNGCKLSLTMRGQLKIELPYGWKSHIYTQKQIVAVTPIDEDKYRSAGGAAAGAIIGGVLTGGIGLLAGAALGGRRRQTSSYLVTFDDGHHIAFEESKKANLKPLIKLIQSDKLKSLISERDALTKSEGKNVIEIPPSVKMTTNERAVIEQVDNRQPDQPEKINKSKGWLIFWGLIVLVFGLSFFSSLDTRTKRDADYEDWKKNYEKGVSKKDNSKEIKKNQTAANSIISEDIIYPRIMKNLIASDNINDFDYSFYDHLIAVYENQQVYNIAYKIKEREVFIELEKKYCSWDDKKTYHKVAKSIQSIHGKKYVKNYVVYCSD